MRKLLIEFVPGLVGGVVGGIAGYFLFGWLLRYGLFAPVLPGALAGLGCGLLSRTDSTIRGILCAVLALVMGVVSEWILMIPPFETDKTLVPAERGSTADQRRLGLRVFSIRVF